MTRRKRGGPGHGRGLPAPRLRAPSPSPPPGPVPEDLLGADELRDHLRRSVADVKHSFDVTATGTLSRAEAETQPLVLTTDTGATWELVLPPGWVVDVDPGARLTVRGDVIDEPSSTQVGPRLRVRSLSRAD